MANTNSNHAVLEQVADAFIGEEVKGADLIALVLQAKPTAKASAIFPAAADILTIAPSSAPYRKFLRKVGTGRYLVLPVADRLDGVNAKGNAAVVASKTPQVAIPDSFAGVPDAGNVDEQPAVEV